jgi:hypothetical protein
MTALFMSVVVFCHSGELYHECSRYQFIHIDIALIKVLFILTVMFSHNIVTRLTGRA